MTLLKSQTDNIDITPACLREIRDMRHTTDNKHKLVIIELDATYGTASLCKRPFIYRSLKTLSRRRASRERVTELFLTIRDSVKTWSSTYTRDIISLKQPGKPLLKGLHRNVTLFEHLVINDCSPSSPLGLRVNEEHSDTQAIRWIGCDAELRRSIPRYPVHWSRIYVGLNGRSPIF